MVAMKSVAAIAALSLFNTAQAWYNELPPCLSPFDPFVYTGCYDNGQPGQKEALSLRTDLDTQNMTVEICVAECKGNGYRLAGLSYYGVCYCGETVSTALLAEDQCSFACTGNSSQTCGGDTEVNIWMDPTFPPLQDQNDISEYVPVGCWTDDSSDGKALFYRQDNVDSSTMTTETCLQSCLSGGFPFAGTEYGGECYCGVVVGNGTELATDSTTCNVPCNGDANQTCGGPARLSLYVAKDLQSLEPCGTPPDTSSTVTTPPATSSYPVSSSSTPVSSSTSSYPVSSSTTPVSSSTSSYPVSSSTTPVSSSTPGYPVSSSTTPVSSSTTPGYPVSSSTTPVSSSTTPGYPVSSSTTTVKTSTTPGYPVSSSTTTVKTSTTPGYPVSSSTTTVKTSTPGYPVSTSTTKGPTTGYPVSSSTTTVKTTTTTSSAPVCTTTYVTPPTCEYQCGNWCSNPIPDWNDHGSCLIAWSQCVIQTTSCFLHAGFPGALQCFEFGNWCGKVKDYCGTNCYGGNCGKSDCYKTSPPKWSKPPVTHTSTIPCPTSTTTKTKTTLTTTTTYPTSSCPVPTPTGVCIQPTSKKYGYGPGNPVGGIELPIVTCNNIKADWNNGLVFKLYTDKDSHKCPSYQRPQCGNACVDACKAQLQQCESVYAEGCKTNSFSQNYRDADAACQAQYSDCVNVNRNIVDSKHCTTWQNSC